MNINNFEVGQTVFILNMHIGRNQEPTIIEATVRTVGRIYLTTDNGHRYVSSENPYVLKEYVDFGDQTLLCPSRTDAAFYIEKLKLEKWLIRISWADVKKYTLEQLRQVEKVLS